MNPDSFSEGAQAAILNILSDTKYRLNEHFFFEGRFYAPNAVTEALMTLFNTCKTAG